MAKIKLEDIRKEAAEHNWEVISTEYKNLKTEMEWRCSEGHEVYAPYQSVRDKWVCPICQKNPYKGTKEVVPKPKGARRVFALDQATHVSGFSIFDDETLVTSGTFTTTEENEIARDHELKVWLINMIEIWKPDLLGFEDIQLQQFQKGIGVTTYKVLAHLQGILMDTAYELQIPYVICSPSTWRAHCGVKGRAKADRKASMQRLVKEWYDIKVTDDESDAIGIGKYVTEKITIGKKIKVEITEWE